jgi:N-sulfoglucosamine sulfohydrolase
VKNLATTPATAAQRAALKGAMYAELKAQGDPRMFGQGALFDRYPHSNTAPREFLRTLYEGRKNHPQVG